MKKLVATYEKIKRLSENGGEVYIRCAGKFAQNLKHILDRDGIRVSAFLDKNYEHIQEISGTPVLPVETVFHKKRGGFFVLVAIESDELGGIICEEMTENGLTPYEDFCDYTFLFKLYGRMNDFTALEPNYDYAERHRCYAQTRLNEMKAIVPSFNATVPETYNLIGNLDVPLTTYCSLKCEHCSHCMPYANPPKHFEAKQIIEDLEKVLSVSYIACVCVMGGEPFVYPDIAEFFRLYRSIAHHENLGFTRIVTNGTVVPSDEFFAEYSKLENAYIYFSNYGEKSKKLAETADKCKRFGVPIYVEPYSLEWAVLGGFTQERRYTEEQLKHLFAVCDAYGCTQLLNGRVYSCFRIPLLNEDGLIPFSERDFCEIRRAPQETLAQSLHKYLYGTPYLDGCKYCDGFCAYSRRIKRGD